MENKIVYGILTIALNAVGVPQFIAGEVGKGIGHICLTAFTCGVGALILEIMGIFKGISILRMSDEEYAATYLSKKTEAAE